MLRVESSFTIKAIKESIQDEVKIPCNEQEIIFDEEILQDHCSLSEFDIQYSKLNVRVEIIGKCHVTKIP